MCFCFRLTLYILDFACFDWYLELLWCTGYSGFCWFTWFGLAVVPMCFLILSYTGYSGFRLALSS